MSVKAATLLGFLQDSPLVKAHLHVPLTLLEAVRS